MRKKYGHEIRVHHKGNMHVCKCGSFIPFRQKYCLFCTKKEYDLHHRAIQNSNIYKLQQTGINEVKQ